MNPYIAGPTYRGKEGLHIFQGSLNPAVPSRATIIQKIKFLLGRNRDKEDTLQLVEVLGAMGLLQRHRRLYPRFVLSIQKMSLLIILGGLVTKTSPMTTIIMWT